MGSIFSAILPAIGTFFGGPIGGAIANVGASLLAPQPKAPEPPVINIQQPAPQPVEEIKPAQATPFTPTRPEALARPEGLAELASFDPIQERSALATRGTQGGLGQEEENYYRNLIQRALIGEGNQVGNLDTLLPVERQYFSGQGLNTSDINSFLRSLQGG